MILAISGYRYFYDYEIFEREVLNLQAEIDKVRVGDASGTDNLAHIFCRKHEIEIRIFKAKWNKYGKAAGPIRNRRLIKKSDHLIAFLSKHSKGTKDSIKYAKSLNIPVTIIHI